MEPNSSATFEVSLYSDVHAPNVKVRIFSQGTPAVVVTESEGNTNVAECSGLCNPTVAGVNVNDTIQVRLSAAPKAGQPVTVSLGDHNAGLVAYYPGGVANNQITLTLSEFHRPQFGGGVVFHHVDEVTFRRHLCRRSRHQHRARQCAQHESYLHETTGP